MTIPMLDLSRLHAPLATLLKQAFSDVLESGRFIGGPAVEQFEQALSEHVGSNHAVAVSSGTDALLVAMMALGVKPGDEVITTPYTFFATAGCISRLGATPVFVDIEPVAFNIDPALIDAAITKKTVGIIPVHLFGQCADMGQILKLAEQRGLWVLEDAAQAIGAEYDGQPAGTMGIAGTFSFFPAKNLGALGDAGGVVMNDRVLQEKIRALTTHGSSTKYHHDMVGGNFRLDAIQAASLSVKLPYLAAWEKGRRNVAAQYKEALSGLLEITLPKEIAGRRHVFNQHVIRTPKRDSLQNALKDASIGSAVYYPKPLHLQACFSNLGYGEGSFPISERAAQESLALPIDPLLSDEAINEVAGIIKKVLK